MAFTYKGNLYMTKSTCSTISDPVARQQCVDSFQPKTTTTSAVGNLATGILTATSGSSSSSTSSTGSTSQSSPSTISTSSTMKYVYISLAAVVFIVLLVFIIRKLRK